MSAVVYAESSGVLAWMLGERAGEPVRQALESAERVVTSRLTLVECARALRRAGAEGRLSEGATHAALHVLDDASAEWIVMDAVGEVMTRAAQPFPREPVRTFDAIHLASALVFHRALAGLTVVTLDERVRENAAALGLA